MRLGKHNDVQCVAYNHREFPRELPMYNNVPHPNFVDNPCVVTVVDMTASATAPTRVILSTDCSAIGEVGQPLHQ